MPGELEPGREERTALAESVLAVIQDWIDRAEGRGLAIVTSNGEADLTTDAGQGAGQRTGSGGAAATRARVTCRRKGAAQIGALSREQS